MAAVTRLRSRPGGFTCPACRTRAGGADGQLGFCTACRKFTGKCAAGRTIRPPADVLRNVIGATSWCDFCTKDGEESWSIGGDGTTVLLCGTHSREIDKGWVPWLDGRRLTIAGKERA